MTATRLGEYRPSMRTNPLLMQSNLGKPLLRGYTLPGPDFVYGHRNIDDPYGAAGAMMQLNNLFAKKNARTMLEKDFIALNREAVRCGLVTEREQMKFRNENDMRVSNKQQKENNECEIPDIMFGVPTRPSTPIFDLLEHKYQKIWQKEQTHKQNKAKEAAKVRHRVGKKKGGEIIVFETRASQMRKQRPVVETREMWHMTKFKKVQPHLETFRCEKDRAKAFEAHESDKSGRMGLQGHGRYEKAKY